MPTWGQVLREIKGSPGKGDSVRRGYIQRLAAHTKRDVILYATAWTRPSDYSPELVSITEEDIQGFMEVVNGLRNPNLDLVLHSPGGSPVAAEAIVKYLRKKFSDIRVIIPQSGMSAAAMVACAGNRIVLGKHSFIGPIDPQFILQTALGYRMVPAQTILDQFELAQEQCKDTAKLGTWLPILSQYGPGLLIECKNAINLSRQLVKEWLKSYMFNGQKRASHKASIVARTLAAHTVHMSHGRHLDRDYCRSLGLAVDDLEQDQTLQDLVLSVFHATTITFDGSPAVKIIENQSGKAFIKMAQGRVIVQRQVETPPAQPATPTAPPGQQPPQQTPSGTLTGISQP